MSEKNIRKINHRSGLYIPAKMRKKLFWDVGTKIASWMENNKIFLRKAKLEDNKSSKFYISKINNQLFWTCPIHWRWYYGFKIGDEFEINFADSSESMVVLTPMNYIFKKPDVIFKKMDRGGLYIPMKMLHIAQIKPSLGGIKITIQKDKILLTPEKIGTAKHFVTKRGLFQIPYRMREELNLPPNSRVELSINNGAIVIKKQSVDYGKFIILSKETREYLAKGCGQF